MQLKWQLKKEKDDKIKQKMEKFEIKIIFFKKKSQKKNFSVHAKSVAQ